MASKDLDLYMKQWLNGDEIAFKGIMDRYYHRMRAFAFQMTRNREDAEELAMNAFFKLWQNKNRIKNISKPDDYLFGILRREVIAHARKKTVVLEPMDQMELNQLGTTEELQINLKDIKNKYQEALKKLSPQQKLIFKMSREQELSQLEIAKKTGLAINTIGNHMNAALKIFREELKEFPKVILIFILCYPTCENLDLIFPLLP